MSTATGISAMISALRSAGTSATSATPVVMILSATSTAIAGAAVDATSVPVSISPAAVRPAAGLSSTSGRSCTAFCGAAS